MKELSVFIDESGDFGEIIEQPAYYLVTLLFHDQKNEIASSIKKLEDSTKNSGFDFEYIHTGPVIRREDVFSGLSIDERRKLLFKMLNFITSCPITYEVAVVNRKEAPNDLWRHLVLVLQIPTLILYCYHINGFEWLINAKNSDIVINQYLSVTFSGISAFVSFLVGLGKGI